MESSELYKSLRLHRAAAEIRLLFVEGARDWDAPLVCHLKVFSIHDCPSFASLSYCWGDQSSKCEIECNGASFWVSENLSCALRGFRSLSESVIWVDQICINQQDLKERNEQILMMKKIYSTARECFVYLGQATENTIHLKHLVNYVKSYTGEAGLGDTLDELTKDLFGFSFKDHDVDEGYNRRHWQRCLFDLIRQPFFSRIWVVQEISIGWFR